MVRITAIREFAMNKPGNERRELRFSAKELGATELDAAIGGTTFFKDTFFKAMSDLLKAQNETCRSLAQNFR